MFNMTYTERQQIHQTHRNAIIKFLMWERAVHIDVLATVIDRHVTQTTRILKKMEEEKIVVSALMPFWATKRTVWGLTHHGAAMATEFVREDEDEAFIEVLVPNNLNTRTVDHRRGIQQIRARHLDSTSYLHANTSGLKNMSWGRSKPDLLWHQNGLWYAIEYEEHLKSYRRYQEIAQTYQNAAENTPNIGGAIIVTKEELLRGLSHHLFKATLYVAKGELAIWTCIAGSPLMASFHLRNDQPVSPGSDRTKQQECVAHQLLEIDDAVWFVGDQFRPRGIYYILEINENELKTVIESDFLQRDDINFDYQQYFYFQPEDVSRPVDIN